LGGCWQEKKKKNMGFLFNFYEINANQKVQCKNNEYIVNNNIIMCSYDDIWGIYGNWLKRKNNEDEMLTYFQNHKDYGEILKTILIDVENGDIWSRLVGSSLCDFGTVDRVEAYCGDVEYREMFIKTEDKIEIVSIFQVNISTELYSDHEFISNGSDNIYIEAKIILDKITNSMEIEQLKLLG